MTKPAVIRRDKMARFVLLSTLYLASLLAKGAASTTDDFANEETLNTMMDSILTGVVEKYQTIQTDTFWHPNAFGSGNFNREIIQIVNDDEQTIEGIYFHWEVQKVGLKQYLLGQQHDSISLFDSQLQKLFTQDVGSPLKAIETYTRWDAVANRPVIIILAATDLNPKMLVYKSDGVDFQELGSFPLPYHIESMTMCRVDDTERIMIVPANSDLSINLYNIEMTNDGGCQLWFSQRINEPRFSSAISHQPDTLHSLLVVSHTDRLNIFKFNTLTGQYDLTQSLPTHGCKRMQSFTLMYQHYISCQEHDESESEDVSFISYNNNMNEYEVKESMKKLKTADFAVIGIDGSRDDSIVMSRSSDGSINFLVSNGNEEFKVGRQCNRAACSDAITISKGTSFVFDDLAACVFPTPAGASAAPVIMIVSEIRENASPVFTQSLGLFNEFKEMSVEMKNYQAMVKNAEETLSNSLNINTDNIITGDWTVQTISTESVSVTGRDANSDSVFKSLKFGDVEWTEEDFSSTNDNILNEMMKLDRSLSSILNLLDDAVLANSAQPQTISTTTRMIGSVTADRFATQSCNVDTVWGFKTDEFFDSLAHKQQDVLNIQGGLQFQKQSTTERLKTATVNGVPTDSFALLSADNVFQCNMEFQNLQTLKDVQVTNINGENLAESVVMPDNINGLQLVTGVVALKGAETKVAYPFDNVLLSSVSQTVQSPMKFKDLEIQSPVLLKNLNDQEFTSFVEKIITKDHQGKIAGMKSIENVENLNSLFMSEWNGLKFPEAFFTTEDLSIQLNGNKKFASLVADNVVVDGLVDEMNTQDVVSLTMQDVVNSVWEFTGPVNIGQNILVDKTVDGVKMEDLMHKGTLNNLEDVFSTDANVIFEVPIEVDNLNVRSSINQEKFNELFSDMYTFDGEECFIKGKTVMNADVIFGDLHLKTDKINGFSIENFMTRDTFQEFDRPVILNRETFFEEMYATKRFDGVQIQDVLNKAARVSESATTMIPWNITFESIKCQNNLRVEGPVNGMMDFGTSVARVRGTSTQTQSFMGPVTVSHPTFNKLTTNSIQLDAGRTVQNMDINAWNENRAKLSESTSFSKPFTASGVVVKADFDTQTVNGKSMEDIRNNVFRSDKKEQVFAGEIQMRGLKVDNGEINFDKKVDGVMLKDIIANGFLLNSDNSKPIIINDDWKFESIEMDKGININGKTCGIDLNEFISDTVKRGEVHTELFGEKTFTKPLEVTGSINSPHINNMKLLDKVFLLHEDQDIPGRVTFSSDMKKDFIQADSINDFPLTWLSQMYSVKDGQHVLNHNVFLDSMSANTMSVKGTMQGQDFDSFLAKAIKLTDDNIAFKDDVTILKPITSEQDIRTGTYNGINVDDLLTKAVQLDQTINVHQPVSFSGVVSSADAVSFGGNVDADNFANGLDWNEMQANAINIKDPDEIISFGNVKFEQIFASSPLTLETLNGRIFSDYATLTSPQDLGTLNITTANMGSSNVKIGGLMGSVDLSREFEDTLMTNSVSQQLVSGAKTISGPVTVKEDMKCFGSQFTDRFVSTTEDITLQGPVTFETPVIVFESMDVTKSIQGHTMESIFSQAFTTTEDHVISGKWKFEGPVTFMKSVSGPGLTEKLNIQKMVERKQEEMRQARSKIEDERQQFVRRCSTLQRIQRDIAENPIKFDSFDRHQSISLKNEANQVLPVVNNDKVLLFLQTKNCDIETYKWEPTLETFNKQVQRDKLIIGSVDSWESAPFNDGSIIVLSKSVSDCSQQTGLHYFIVNANGDWLSSETNPIVDQEVTSFSLKKDEQSGNIILFAIFTSASQQLNVYQWDGRQFVQTGMLPFDSPMTRVDSTSASTGLGFVCQNENTVHMYEYSAVTNDVITEAKRSILASSTAPIVTFNNFDVVYSLVPESGSSSFTRSNCNYQLMQLRRMDKNVSEVQSVQKLQFPEVVSTTQFRLSNNDFVSVLSQSYGLSLYKFMGLNGLQQVGTPYKIFGGFLLRSFFAKVSGFDAPRPFILTLSRNSIDVFHGNVFGDNLSLDFSELCVV